VYTILEETSEEFDDDNNPIINLQNIMRGTKYMAEGETKETIATRVKVCLTIVEWETIKTAINLAQSYIQSQPEKF
jgi:hypothetical protein